MEISIRKKTNNWMKMEFEAVSANESLARIAVASFITGLNPTVEEMADIKTAVSEAVTNAIIHGYQGNEGQVRVFCEVSGREIFIRIEDDGVGISDVEKAREPFFTTKPELERSGMGFAFMEAFMDEVQVVSVQGKGTRVTLKKEIGKQEV